MITTNLGYPRIGRGRELKWAIERYWRGEIDRLEMTAQVDRIRSQSLREQIDRGVDLVPSNDFSLYDQVLDHAVMFGAVPERFGWKGGRVDVDVYFAMARGTEGAVSCEMTKWFNTNYHYIVPEFEGHFELTENRPLASVRSARAELGIETKPVIVGPLTFLSLADNRSGRSFETLMADLVPLYARILRELAADGVEWIQIDEPILVTDVTRSRLDLLEAAYGELARAKGSLRIMLQTYFNDVVPSYERIVGLPVDGIGLDFVWGPHNEGAMERHGFPREKFLGIGIVNGRNVWRTDLDAAMGLLDRLGRMADLGTAHLGPSSSLLHLPVSLDSETDLDPAILRWLAYANERLDEIRLLSRAFREGRETIARELAACREVREERRSSPRAVNPSVRKRLEGLTDADFTRGLPAPERRRVQQERMNLPGLPTTTIGSYPQTAELRSIRARYQKGEIGESEYQGFLEQQYRHVIRVQEELGLDVLVHGEFERSDMVDFFAQRLDGMAFIQGWVQSYGSRCVRPPLIFGDVSRAAPMTVEVSRRVQQLTEKPVKGMLTGPVTILMWSFPRDDISREEVAYQLALAIRDETIDLEHAGVRVIQIDEPAFREGLPLKRSDWEVYLRWAGRAFRLASSGIGPGTQIHTHMCYSDFNDIMSAILGLDADVISIENSRSGGELLGAFRTFEYDRGIGPGVYDVHSERVPSVEDMRDLLLRAAEVIDPGLLWVNPDCGLKTRDWKEVIPALRHMVDAARQARKVLFREGRRGG